MIEAGAASNTADGPAPSAETADGMLAKASDLGYDERDIAALHEAPDRLAANAQPAPARR